jgi:hypothetical protein
VTSIKITIIVPKQVLKTERLGVQETAPVEDLAEVLVVDDSALGRAGRVIEIELVARI